MVEGQGTGRRGVVETGRRGRGEEEGEEVLEVEFNLHMVCWPINKGQEL